MFESSQRSSRAVAAAVSRTARTVAIAWSAVLASACAPEVPSGRFSCNTDGDCPSGWACAENAHGQQRCFPTGSDGRAIRGEDQPRATDAGGTEPTEPTEPPDAAPEPAADSGPEPAPAAGSGGKAPVPPAAGSGGSAGQVSPPPVAGSAPPPPPPPTECAAPDAAKGVFAAPLDRGGSTEADCGTAAKPCASVQRAMERALSGSKSTVYLDRGTFVEPVVLLPKLKLQGGNVHDAGTWTRSCDADRASLTRIESPTEVGIWVEYEGASELETLTIATMAEAPAGHTTYGVFARGINTTLRLRDVHVIAASGGNGGRGTAGVTPAPREGTCGEPSDGANGAMPGQPGIGGAAGMFDSSGYVPGDGTPGGAGLPGNNGAAGTKTCRNCVDTCDPTSCGSNVIGQSCGFPGAAGCGGLAAAGGGGGQGGGSSIAVYTWGARIQVDGGSLIAGNGGRGGAGGEPGQGGAGSEGAAGLNGEACTVCVKGGLIPIDPPDPSGSLSSLKTSGQAAEADIAVAGTGAIGRPILDAGIIVPINCTEGKGYGVGTAGTRGGSGSAGGLGGSGAGGNSYGAYSGGGGNLAISSSTRIEVGQRGMSEGNGAAGDAKDIVYANPNP